MDDVRDIEPIASDEPTLSPRHVRLALTYLRDNLSERVTLSELVSFCAVPERTLLKQFRKFLGLPPLTYLRRLRLNAARSRLTDVDCKDAIAGIAISCGFAHLGRFSTEYRRAFGETPSATRRRARDHVADAATIKRRPARPPEDAVSLPAPIAWREKSSLLILPLRTETAEACREARDLTERLGATLSRMRIATVTLAHPSHVQSMKAPQPRNAGTRYGLLGRLTRDGDRTRVIIRLIDVVADRHIWGDSFDGSANDPFALQDRVVDGVLCGVVASITDAEVERVHSKDPRDRAARDLAMQAWPLILNASVPSALEAISILECAIELDPSDALAVALLACCHTQLFNYQGTPSPLARDAALRLARRAGLLDSSDPLVTTARAMVAAISSEPDEGRALATRALAMDPTSAWAWERNGFARLGSGEHPDRAIADFLRSLQLRGPAWPRGNCFIGVASAHRAAGRPQEAMLWTRKALVENPDAAWLYRELGRAAFAMGDQLGMVQAVDCWRRAQPGVPQTVDFGTATTWSCRRSALIAER
jgi:AraC-like DNA-binding protein/TolB-like protein